ncbi:MAG: tRNA (guanosine(46)-N7)-methyltransferase TrmB, partial [Candidatus Izemoplasmataceae bacterium]
MRLRKVKDADLKIESYPEYILNIPRGEKYCLNNAFKEKKPLHVEIGSGKGQFIHEMAKRNPHINFIA